MRSRKEDALCFVCDFWWLILLILSLIIAAISLRNLWGPALFPSSWPYSSSTRTHGPTTSATLELSTGDIQVTLKWEGLDDLDLHVIEPSGERIYFENKLSASGGQLEVDANAGCHSSITDNPVEHIFWPTGEAPEGKYEVIIHYFRKCDVLKEIPYIVEITTDGVSQVFEGKIENENEVIRITTMER